MMKYLSVIILILASLMSINVKAALIDLGDITYDNVTKLGWLDVSSTVGQSYNTVESQMRSGALLDGFRHATKSEVGELFIQLGLPFGYNGPTLPAVDTLINLFGNTVNSGSNTVGVLGLTTPDSIGDPANVAFAFNRLNLNTSEVIFIGRQGTNLTDIDVGHWVVADNYVVSPVPLPGSGLLLASGIFLLLRLKSANK